MTKPTEPVYFASPQALRDWFAAHAASAKELLVGFHKIPTGRAGLTWPQSVDEALCVGWIDGVRRRIDESRYQIRFTPRSPRSTWSAVNIERVRVLSLEGRMQPAGLAAFALCKGPKPRAFTKETPLAELSPAELKCFRRARAAWAFFEAQAPSYRRKLLWWVTSAKQEATRERRLAALIEASAGGRRLG